MQRTEQRRPGRHVYPLAKVIEVIASSEKGFDDAVMVAIREASRTVRGIHGLEITGFNVKISNDKPVEFRIACKVAFEVER